MNLTVQNLHKQCVITLPLKLHWYGVEGNTDHCPSQRSTEQASLKQHLHMHQDTYFILLMLFLQLLSQVCSQANNNEQSSSSNFVLEPRSFAKSAWENGPSLLAPETTATACEVSSELQSVREPPSSSKYATSSLHVSEKTIAHASLSVSTYSVLYFAAVCSHLDLPELMTRMLLEPSEAQQA